MTVLVVLLLSLAGAVPANAGIIEGCVREEGVVGAPENVRKSVVVLGDFGTGATGANGEVAAALRAFLAERSVPVERVLLLGDNFYPQGLIGLGARCGAPLEPRRMTAQLREVVGPFAFLREKTITVALPGNHDHRCPESGSLRNQARIDRWLPPRARWGDRWRLVEGMPEEIFRDGDLQIVAIDSPRMTRDELFLDRSMARLDGLLAQGTPRWRLVAAHHPLHATGAHGGRAGIGVAGRILYPVLRFLGLAWGEYETEPVYGAPNRRYREALATVLDRRGVDLLLAGHEHALELLRPAEGPLVAVSGAAARCSRITRDARTVFGASRNGFLVLSVAGDDLILEFVGTAPCSANLACAPAEERGSWHVLYRTAIEVWRGPAAET